jgi:hypothetical protein
MTNDIDPTHRTCLEKKKKIILIWDM